MWCVFQKPQGEASGWWIMWICLMTLQNYSGRLFFANRVSLSCTVSANWWPKGQKFPLRMAVTSPGVGFTTRRLEKTNRRVGNTNRRLRKTTRRLVKATSPTMYMTWICPFLRAHVRPWYFQRAAGRTFAPFRARVYAFHFPKKAFTPSHVVYFSLIFKSFQCEGLRFQVFTRVA